MRLLKLPAEVQLGLRDKALDMGHARALLSIDKPSQQLKLYNEIVNQGLSVRQVEQRVKEYNAGVEDKAAAGKPAKSGKDYRFLQRHLTASFGVPVKFTCDTLGRGRITFPFKSEAELEKIIAMFDQLKEK